MKRIVGCFVVLVMLLAAVAASAEDVSFEMDKGVIRVNEEVKVKFNAPLPKSGEHYWIAYTYQDWLDMEWLEKLDLAAGTKEITIMGPSKAGIYELRLYDQFPAQEYHMIAKQTLRVTAEQSKSK